MLTLEFQKRVGKLERSVGERRSGHYDHDAYHHTGQAEPVEEPRRREPSDASLPRLKVVKDPSTGIPLLRLPGDENVAD